MLTVVLLWAASFLAAVLGVLGFLMAANPTAFSGFLFKGAKDAAIRENKVRKTGLMLLIIIILAVIIGTFVFVLRF